MINASHLHHHLDDSISPTQHISLLVGTSNAIRGWTNRGWEAHTSCKLLNLNSYVVDKSKVVERQ